MLPTPKARWKAKEKRNPVSRQRSMFWNWHCFASMEQLESALWSTMLLMLRLLLMSELMSVLKRQGRWSSIPCWASTPIAIFCQLLRSNPKEGY